MHSYAYSVDVDPSARAEQHCKDDEADHDGSHALRPQHRRQRGRRPPGPLARRRRREDGALHAQSERNGPERLNRSKQGNERSQDKSEF